MTTLFIHIGYPKTATTTFQRHVFPHHPQIDYLGKYIPGFEFRDASIGVALQGLITQDDTRYGGGDDLRRRLDEHRQASKKPVILLSTESFLHPFANDRGLVARRLSTACAPCRIVITVREQLSIIRSFFAMHGRFGQYLYLEKAETERCRFPLSFEAWHMYAQRGYDHNFLSSIHYGETVQYYQRVFGPENVGVFLFEQFVQHKDEYVRALCRFMGIDAEQALSLVAGKHEMPNMSRREYLRLRLLSLFRRQVPFHVVGAGRDRPDAPRERVQIPAHLENQLKDRYRAGNQALAQSTGLPLERYGYAL